MRDVNNGWLIRYLHSNTASAFFFVVNKCAFFYDLYLDIYTENEFVYTPLGFNIGLSSKLEYSCQEEGNPGSNYPLLFLCCNKKKIPLSSFFYMILCTEKKNEKRKLSSDSISNIFFFTK